MTLEHQRRMTMKQTYLTIIGREEDREREGRDGHQARTDLVVGEGHPHFEGGLESDDKNLKQRKLA